MSNEKWGDTEDQVDVKINLDVGGAIFSTLSSTLMKAPYFSSCVFTDKDIFFVDRDPCLFGYVLNFLRTGRVMCYGWEEKCFLESLKLEAMFYGVAEMVDEIDSHVRYYKTTPIPLQEVQAVRKPSFNRNSTPRTRSQNESGW